jgi:glycosyltransferase involved in cell wall biosynthesis
MNKNKSICVISTVHPDNDTRILKQCRTLRQYFSVDLIIQSEKDDDDGIKIIPLPIIKNRIQRLHLMFLAIRLSFKKKYDYYLFHDPELILLGIILKIFRRKVIYDIHEDYQVQILDKHWIPIYLKKTISFIFFLIEKISSKFFDSLICATPFIFKKFSKINKNVYCVRNFPPRNELIHDHTRNFQNSDRFKILYVGVISEERSIINILDAIKDIDCEFILAGNFSPASLKDFTEKHDSWKKVRYLGYVNRKDFSSLLNEADLGILLFQPQKAHIDSLPNKMFEYMAGGLYQLSSNFEEWKTIIELNNVGQTINPLDTDELSKKIVELKNNKEMINKLGPKIREIFTSNFTWETESIEFLKVFDVHEKI